MQTSFIWLPDVQGIARNKQQILKESSARGLSAVAPGWGGGGGGVLPYKRLMGVCRWRGAHFHD